MDSMHTHFSLGSRFHELLWGAGGRQNCKTGMRCFTSNLNNCSSIDIYICQLDKLSAKDTTEAKENMERERERELELELKNVILQGL